MAGSQHSNAYFKRMLAISSYTSRTTSETLFIDAKLSPYDLKPFRQHPIVRYDAKPVRCLFSHQFDPGTHLNRYNWVYPAPLLRPVSRFLACFLPAQMRSMRTSHEHITNTSYAFPHFPRSQKVFEVTACHVKHVCRPRLTLALRKHNYSSTWKNITSFLYI